MKKSTLERRFPSVNKVKKKVSIIVITFCANFVSLLSHNCNVSLSGHCATTDSTDLMGNFFFCKLCNFLTWFSCRSARENFILRNWKLSTRTLIKIIYDSLYQELLLIFLFDILVTNLDVVLTHWQDTNRYYERRFGKQYPNRDCTDYGGNCN